MNSVAKSSEAKRPRVELWIQVALLERDMELRIAVYYYSELDHRNALLENYKLKGALGKTFSFRYLRIIRSRAKIQLGTNSAGGWQPHSEMQRWVKRSDVDILFLKTSLYRLERFPTIIFISLKMVKTISTRNEGTFKP